MVWQVLYKENHYMSEMHFLPRPGGKAEDDGALITIGFDGPKEQSYLLIIDAKTFTPINKVEHKICTAGVTCVSPGLPAAQHPLVSTRDALPRGRLLSSTWRGHREEPGQTGALDVVCLPSRFTLCSKNSNK